MNDTIMIVDLKGALFTADAKGDSFRKAGDAPYSEHRRGLRQFRAQAEAGRAPSASIPDSWFTTWNPARNRGHSPVRLV